MDIGPDQVHLNWAKKKLKEREKEEYESLQCYCTEAEIIVKNFEKIEEHWNSIESQNKYWKTVTVALGISLLLTFYYHG